MKGLWDYKDPKYPHLDPMVIPMMCNNQGFILAEVARMLHIGREEEPQRHGHVVCDTIYKLLDFCVAHNIDIETTLEYKLRQQ